MRSVQAIERKCLWVDPQTQAVRDPPEGECDACTRLHLRFTYLARRFTEKYGAEVHLNHSVVWRQMAAGLAEVAASEAAAEQQQE